MRGAHDRAVASGAGGRAGPPVCAAQHGWGLPARVGAQNYRKCGKPNCACAAADHPGHGPRFLWTRSAGSRKTIGPQLAAAEVEKVRREIARYAEFTAAVEQIAEVNERICEARPAAGTRPRRRRAKRGALRTARAKQVRRDSTAGGRSGPGAGRRRRAGGRRDCAARRAAEARGSMLGQLLSADPGQRGAVS